MSSITAKTDHEGIEVTVDGSGADLLIATGAIMTHMMQMFGLKDIDDLLTMMVAACADQIEGRTA